MKVMAFLAIMSWSLPVFAGGMPVPSSQKVWALLPTDAVEDGAAINQAEGEAKNEAAYRAELEFRRDVLAPLCRAAEAKILAEAAIKGERENPTGVVDLRVLHEHGRILQEANRVLRGWGPAYKARRGFVFRSSNEKACEEGV